MPGLELLQQGSLAVSAVQGVQGGGGSSRAAAPCPHSGPAPSERSPLPCSVPPVPSASCPERNCSCTRLSSTEGRSCLCVRSVGTGRPAAMACKCTSKPSTGGGGPVFPQGPGLCQLQAGEGTQETADTHTVFSTECGACGGIRGMSKLPSRGWGRAFQAKTRLFPLGRFSVSGAPSWTWCPFSWHCPSPPSARQLIKA